MYTKTKSKIRVQPGTHNAGQKVRKDMKEITKHEFKLIEKSLNDMAKAFLKDNELEKAEEEELETIEELKAQGILYNGSDVEPW